MSQYKVMPSPDVYPEVQELKTVVKVLDTYLNLEYLLCKKFDAVIRYNLMTRKREINIPNHNISSEDKDNAALARVTYLATVNSMPINQLDSHLDVIAFANTYHPIVECIKNKQWDKQKRLDSFIKTIKSKNDTLTYKVIKTWMIAAIAAAHSVTGFINQGVLVLQGKQKIGKTSWVKSLDPINCGAVKESAFLDPDNKDNIAQLASYWISEMGELDSIFKKSEIGRLKSFVTMEFDDVRAPYARKSNRLARRSVYVATVNDGSFLVDDTGNRRWWTISVDSIDLNHGLDMQQVWAEAYYEWTQGALTDLSFEIQDQVNSENLQFEKIDPLKEKVLTMLDWSNSIRVRKTATQVLGLIGYSIPTRADATQMGKVLKDINKCAGSKSNGLLLHEVPPNIIFTK